MGIEQLYIIYQKLCADIVFQLYKAPHSVSIQLQRVGFGAEALPPKNQFRLALQYASYLAKFWPNYVIFTILFRAWSKILSPISNQVLHSSLKTWWEKLPKKMLSSCVLLKVYFVGGIS